MDLLFVVNPSSGSQMKKDVKPIITRFLNEQDLTWELMETTGSGDAERLKDRIEELHPKTIVGVGGDGTLNLVASQLVLSKIPMGIIPAGSANGLAYNLDIPSDVEQALHKILNNRVKVIDALLLNDKFHCLHLADVGLNARVVKRFEKEETNGIGGYALQLIKELFSKKRFFRFRLAKPHETEEMKAEILVISNAKSYGTGALINPEGRIDDGKFELVLIKPYPWWHLFRLMLSAFSGNIHKMHNVEIISTDEALITFNKPVDLQVDGEVMEGICFLKVHVLPGALRIIQ